MAKIGKSKTARMEELKRQKAVFEAKMERMSEILAQRRNRQRKQVQLWVGAFCLEEATQNGTLDELKTKVAEGLTRGIEKQLVLAWESE